MMSFGSLRNSTQFRRDRHKLGAAAQQAHLGRAQQAETRLEGRLERILALGEGVIARAKQRKMVVGKPFQEVDRFGDFIDRKRRRVVSQVGDDAIDPRQHLLPVLDRNADIAQYSFEFAQDACPLFGILDSRDVHMNKAFAVRSDGARAPKRNELAGGIALDKKYRMDKEADIDPTLGQLADHGVDQKRHVVVDDLEYRYAGPRGGFETQLGHSALARGEKRPGLLGDARQFLGRVALEVVRNGKAEQVGQEILGNFAVALGEQDGRSLDKRHAFIVAGAPRAILDVHRAPPYRPLSVVDNTTRFTCSSASGGLRVRREKGRRYNLRFRCMGGSPVPAAKDRRG